MGPTQIVTTEEEPSRAADLETVPSLPSGWTRVDWTRLRDQCLVGVAALFFVYAFGLVLQRITRPLLLVLLAIVVAFVLEPAVRRLESIMPRVAATLAIYLACFIAVGVLGYAFGPPLTAQAAALAANLPDYSTKVWGVLQGLAGHFGISLPPLTPGSAAAALQRSFQGSVSDLLVGAIDLAQIVVSVTVDIILVLVLAFYFVVDGRRLIDLLIGLWPARHREKVRFVQQAVSQVGGAYIRGQLVVAATIGFLAFLGALILGLPYPVVIGALALVFELIPLLGPTLSAMPAVLIAIFQPDPLPLVLKVILYFSAIQMLENHILVPRIQGRAVGLHPALALLALVIGIEVAGIWGALFAVPVAGILTVLVIAGWKAARGQPVVVERGGVKLRLRLTRRSRRSRHPA